MKSLSPWKKFLNRKKGEQKLCGGPRKLLAAVVLPSSVWRDQSGLWLWRISLIDW